MAARRDTWESLTTEQKKLLLGGFIARVTAHRPRGSAETEVEIFWRHAAQGMRGA